MDKPPLTQSDEPVEGLVYQHFKGGKYEVLSLDIDTDTGGQRVSYRALYGTESYSRRLEDWLSPSETGAKRFTLISNGFEG